MKTWKYLLPGAVAVGIGFAAIRLIPATQPAKTETQSPAPLVRTHSAAPPAPEPAPVVAPLAKQPAPAETVEATPPAPAAPVVPASAPPAAPAAVANTPAAPAKPKKQWKDPEARAALALVGVDPAAEEYWRKAINNPDLPAGERSDLIEDLNEVGIDPKKLTLDDVPLIMARMAIIERHLPDAMDTVNADAFAEAYKDLKNMLARLK